jgi:acyl carrier protein
MLELVLAAASAAFGRDVRPQDDFFSVGGDSLSAMEFILRLESELGVEIEADSILSAENFAAFAENLAGEPS